MVITPLMDRADILKTMARKAKLSRDAQNDWAEYKLDAERKAGSILQQMDKNKGGRPSKTPTTDNSVMEGRGLSEQPPTCPSWGSPTTKRKSLTRWGGSQLSARGKLISVRAPCPGFGPSTGGVNCGAVGVGAQFPVIGQRPPPPRGAGRFSFYSKTPAGSVKPSSLHRNRYFSGAQWV